MRQIAQALLGAPLPVVVCVSPQGARAATLAQRPEAMQLRYLQTMTQVAGDRA